MITLDAYDVQEPRIYADQLPQIAAPGVYTASIRLRDFKRGNNKYEVKYFAVELSNFIDSWGVLFETVASELTEDLPLGIVAVRLDTEYEFAIYDCNGYQPGATGEVFSDKIIFKA